MKRRLARAPERVFLDDGRYKVTAELFSTPRRFYPIVHTSARIRRDPLWLACGIALFATLTSAIYGDLLFAIELIVMWMLTVTVAALGAGIAVLQVDAIGHPKALIAGPIWRMRALYEAMREARSVSGNPGTSITLVEADAEVIGAVKTTAKPRRKVARKTQ